ncbi:phosphodiester glycosidase family protein [Alicyclobacillus suci]|uniref:phosphodiester glycosidase family protein n=1 Tax=Alicyclobacillus suci TaxID=2816080 RepID=UPI001A8C09B1|nr:phosphodiester glycosidase family protein [Alicyclobacillus suci]
MYHGRYQPPGTRKQEPEVPKGKPALRWAVFFFVCFIYFCVSTSLWVFHGPFQSLRNYVIDTFDETRHGYLLRPLSLFTLPNSVIAAHALADGGMVSETTPIDEIRTQNFDNNDGSIQLETYNGQTFTAHIMIVDDPKRIKVATTRYLGKRGETVLQMVEDTGAVAGVNGGAFSDANEQGTGAYPLGITMHDGKVITGAGSTGKHAEIAFTSGGQLIAGNYSLADLREKNVQEALSFGPVLVLNGQPVQVPDQGYNPRTAIGQTADGKVILVVTDGRGQYGHLGASMADITAIMLKYHAVTAVDLDGGSSTTMVYHDKLVNTPVDLTGARSVATSIVVMPESRGQ